MFSGVFLVKYVNILVAHVCSSFIFRTVLPTFHSATQHTLFISIYIGFWLVSSIMLLWTYCYEHLFILFDNIYQFLLVSIVIIFLSLTRITRELFINLLNELVDQLVTRFVGMIQTMNYLSFKLKPNRRDRRGWN